MRNRRLIKKRMNFRLRVFDKRVDEVASKSSSRVGLHKKSHPLKKSLSKIHRMIKTWRMIAS